MLTTRSSPRPTTRSPPTTRSRPCPKSSRWSAASARPLRTELWLMRVDGRPVGTYRLDLPQLDNTDLVEVELGIHPQHQHRGHGAPAVRARLRSGPATCSGTRSSPRCTSRPTARRTGPCGSPRRPVPGGPSGRCAGSWTSPRWTVPRLAALRAEAESRSGAYQLVAWTGPCPDDLVDGYAALIGRMSTDAPMGDLHIEPEHWDAARVRERDTLMAAQGRLCMADRRSAGSGRSAGRVHRHRHHPRTTRPMRSSGTPSSSGSTADTGSAAGQGREPGSDCSSRPPTPGGCTPGTPTRTRTWSRSTAAMGFAPAQRESAWRLDLPRVD